MLGIDEVLVASRRRMTEANSKAARQERALLLLSLVSAVVYFLALPWQPYQGQFLVKALIIAPLAALPLVVKAAPRRGLLALALFASLIGDICLVFEGSAWFMRGLVAFLVTHLFYIYLFARRTRRPLRLSGRELLAVALLVLGAGTVVACLWPGLGAMRIPVLLYATALTTMNICGLLTRLPGLFIGTLLFLLSDALLGLMVFRNTPAVTVVLISICYYTAQVLIVSGYLARCGEISDRPPRSVLAGA